MPYLVEAIIEQIEGGTSPQAVALQALMPNGAVEQAFADFDLRNVSLPYIAIIEGETTLDTEGTNHSYRIEKTPVAFYVFANTRQQAADVAEALDNFLMATTLSNVTGRTVLNGNPFFVSRLPVWKRDLWQSHIAYYWLLQK
jgi:hypothetical protein